MYIIHMYTFMCVYADICVHIAEGLWIMWGIAVTYFLAWLKTPGLDVKKNNLTSLYLKDCILKCICY